MSSAKTTWLATVANDDDDVWRDGTRMAVLAWWRCCWRWERTRYESDVGMLLPMRRVFAQPELLEELQCDEKFTRTPYPASLYPQHARTPPLGPVLGSSCFSIPAGPAGGQTTGKRAGGRAIGVTQLARVVVRGSAACDACRRWSGSITYTSSWLQLCRILHRSCTRRCHHTERQPQKPGRTRQRLHSRASALAFGCRMLRGSCGLGGRSLCEARRGKERLRRPHNQTMKNDHGRPRSYVLLFSQQAKSSFVVLHACLQFVARLPAQQP